MKATPETILSLAARTATKIGSFDPEQSEVDSAIQNSNHPYWKAIEGVFSSPEQPKKIQTPLVSLADRWRAGVVKLYQDFMNIDVTQELEKFAFPTDRPSDFNWFVFRPQGLTAQMALDKLCKPQFSVQEYITVDDYSLERTPEQPHLVLCRETVEPDKKWLNHSGDDMSATKLPFLDICDRVVLEAIYFSIFKKHLDIKGVTRCPSSRHDADVAYADWYPSVRECWVGAYHRGLRDPDCGGREAIVLPLKPSQLVPLVQG